MKKWNIFMLVFVLVTSSVIWCFQIHAQEADAAGKFTRKEEAFTDADSDGTDNDSGFQISGNFLLDIDRETALDKNYYQGLFYYCNCYEYGCEIAYLQQYLTYVELQTNACGVMYEMGEVTEADLKSYQAQLAFVGAQIQAAENQRDYNQLFLDENMLDYSDYQMEEKKDVHEIAYYIEQYPGKNHMLMAEYVTDYHNALVLSDAKKVELEAQTMRLDAARRLYDAGEISLLELSQQETALAKIQYELGQYFAEMNRSYANLKIYCG